jgi:hypothetical protein
LSGCALVGTERLTVREATEDVLNDRWIDVELGDIVADVFVGCVTEEI